MECSQRAGAFEGREPRKEGIWVELEGAMGHERAIEVFERCTYRQSFSEEVLAHESLRCVYTANPSEVGGRVTRMDNLGLKLF